MNSWLLFALLGPLCWGLGNVLDSVLLRKYVQSNTAMTWYLGVSRIPLIVVMILITGFAIPSLHAAWWMFFSGFIWIAAYLFYYRAMEYEDPSHIVLLMQSMPIFTLLIAVTFFNERLGVAQLIGFLLILIGGFLSSLKPAKERWHISKALPIMVIASFMWGLSDALYKYISQEFPTFWHAFSIFFLGGLFCSLLSPLIAKKDYHSILHYTRNLPRRAWIFLLSTLALNAIGMISFSYALTLGKASLSSVITEIQPLITFSFGILLAKVLYDISPEDTRPRALIMKGIAFCVILGGLFLLQ